MLKLIIEDDEGRKTVVPFVRDEITIGRQEGNTIRLTERNVSRRHARLVRQNGSVTVEDLGSYNGIRLNGEKIAGLASVADGDLIQIGDYDLAIEHEGAEQPGHLPTLPAESAASRSNGAQAPQEEPQTESASPVYEEAEPLPEGEEDTSPSQRRPESENARRQSTSIIRVDQVEGARPRQVVELDPEEAPRLVVLNTEFAGREFACIRTELRIGRTDDNDISLDHRSLSRTHAKLVREDNGEWRVIDLQSANGLLVNGEPYAQATVNHLDTIELGHLKLKFVAAGESFSFAPEDDDSPSTVSVSKSKLPLVLGGLAVVAVVAGVAAFVSLGGKKDQPPPQVAQTAPPKAAAPASAAAPAPAPPPAQAQAQTQAAQARPPDPAEVAAASARPHLIEAKKALDESDFEAAQRELEAVRAIPHVPQATLAEAEALLEKAKGERLNKDRLDQAEKAIASGDYAQARQLLEDTSATQAFAVRRGELKQDLAAKLDDEADRKKQSGAAARVKPASAESDEAARLFDEGKKLLEKRQTREARATLLKCVEASPHYAPCHLLLGAAHAKLGEMDQGARHYQLFLQLSPDAPEASKVRLMLEQYQAAKKQQ